MSLQLREHVGERQLSFIALPQRGQRERPEIPQQVMHPIQAARLARVQVLQAALHLRDGLGVQQLTQVGLMRYFDGRVFSGHEMPRSKPAPDVYLAAAAHLGAERALAVRPLLRHQVVLHVEHEVDRLHHHGPCVMGRLLPGVIRR